MTRPRKELVCTETTPYYHIVSRCVRRTYLCGYDKTTDTCYEHRRQWIEDRIRLLSSIFAVDICAFAMMSNHYHIVVKLDPKQTEQWTDFEVLQRWQCLYKGTLLTQRYAAGDTLSKIERDSVSEVIAQYRLRLGELSWFMKCLNEPIARRANQEDRCTGHFWESRYKSQALLTEEALLSAMAYTDLNPIRAKMAKTPETSDHTSIKERIRPSINLDQAVTQAVQHGELNNFNLPLKPLLKFDAVITNNESEGIPFSFEDYLSLVDWTGRAMREDKRGFIDNDLPSILSRLSIESPTWLENATEFEMRYRQRFQKMRSCKIKDTG